MTTGSEIGWCVIFRPHTIHSCMCAFFMLAHIQGEWLITLTIGTVRKPVCEIGWCVIFLPRTIHSCMCAIVRSRTSNDQSILSSDDEHSYTVTQSLRDMVKPLQYMPIYVCHNFVLIFRNDKSRTPGKHSVFLNTTMWVSGNFPNISYSRIHQI